MKDTKVQKILVYTDFTEVGEKSVQWGVFLAKKFKRKLQLIHVINENTYNYFSQANADFKVKETLIDFCKDIKETHSIDCDYFVDEGCTCTIINSTAERIDAFLVILGAHGKNDPQFLSGAATVKIIRKARIPYFIVQKNTPPPDEKKKIVMPLDYRKETKEKTGWVTYFAKNLESNIELNYFKEPEDSLKKNIKFCTNFFDKYGLSYTKSPLSRNRSSIDKIALKNTDAERTLCMCILTTKEESLITKIFGFLETSIISNTSGIPILCINPKKNLYIPCI